MEKMQGYYGAIRQDLLNLVPPEAASVLDIGCGTGNLGHALRETRGCRVTGVEIVPEIAAQACRKLDRVVTGSAEVALHELDGEVFDLLILGDSLEHLADPARFLAEVRRLMAPAAWFLISIPNVAHWSVVRMLAQGHWLYDRGGIMDDTHLRWFTLRSAADLLSSVGFQIERIEAEMSGGPGMPRRFVRACRALNMDMQGMEIASQCYQYRLLGRVLDGDACAVNRYEDLIKQIETPARTAYRRYEFANGRLKWLWRNYAPAPWVAIGTWLRGQMRAFGVMRQGS